MPAATGRQGHPCIALLSELATATTSSLPLRAPARGRPPHMPCMQVVRGGRRCPRPRRAAIPPVAPCARARLHPRARRPPHNTPPPDAPQRMVGRARATPPPTRRSLPCTAPPTPASLVGRLCRLAPRPEGGLVSALQQRAALAPPHLPGAATCPHHRRRAGSLRAARVLSTVAAFAWRAPPHTAPPPPRQYQRIRRAHARAWALTRRPAS